MENFGLFAFLVNRADFPNYVVFGALPSEIFNIETWTSVLRLSKQMQENHKIKFPEFDGRLQSGTFSYSVRFKNGNILQPVYLAKFSKNILLSEIFLPEGDTSDYVLNIIPRKVEILGYDELKNIISSGVVNIKEVNLKPVFDNNIFEVDYSTCKEILDIDNKISIPVSK